MPRRWTIAARLFALAALAFVLSVSLKKYAGTLPDRVTEVQQSVWLRSSLKDCVSVAGLLLGPVWYFALLAGCVLVGKTRFIGPLTLQQSRSLASPARSFTLSLLSLGLCVGLCGRGSQFGESQTFSTMQDYEAGLGTACFFAFIIFGCRAAGTLITQLRYRSATRGQADAREDRP